MVRCVSDWRIYVSTNCEEISQPDQPDVNKICKYKYKCYIEAATAFHAGTISSEFCRLVVCRLASLAYKRLDFHNLHIDVSSLLLSVVFAVYSPPAGKHCALLLWFPGCRPFPVQFKRLRDCNTQQFWKISCTGEILGEIFIIIIPNFANYR